MATTRAASKSRWTGSHHFPKTRSEVPWVAPFRYDCTEGHRVEADRAQERCLACHEGEPCAGALRKLSRSAR